MIRPVAVAVRVKLEVKRATERAAMDEHRTVASFLNKLLIEHLKNNGYLTEKSVAIVGKRKRQDQRRAE